MLAKKRIPDVYRQWNQRWGAPFGNDNRMCALCSRLSYRLGMRIRGPFCIQPNNDTRSFEYPWAFFSAKLERGMRVLEIGGGLSGFQFVLSKHGLHVDNVDPGFEAKGKGWKCDHDSVQYMNRVFGSKVTLLNCTLPEASLRPESYDRIYSISVLEHLDGPEVESTIRCAFRCLRPGGLFVVTTDLFLDIVPFTTRQQNVYGRNIEVGTLFEGANFSLVNGNKAELYGYNEFDADLVQSSLGEYYIGSGYPTLVQAVVFQKPL